MRTLYYSRNYNPRLAVAVARHLNAPVQFEFAQPFHPDHAAHFLALNPNQKVPILLEGDKPLWEADAIACRLSRLMGSDFWRTGEDEPEMIRWISWGYWGFIRACDAVHWERVTKQRYGIGPVEEAKVADGLAEFHQCAPILNAALTGNRKLGNRKLGDWILGDRISYADFRLACVLPHASEARLPLADYPAIDAWNARLNALPAWADPFEGLDAPPLPPVP